MQIGNPWLEYAVHGGNPWGQMPAVPPWWKPSDTFIKFGEENRVEIKTEVEVEFPNIDNVIFNGPATIVFWNDKTKTVVKRSPSEPNDLEKAVLTAFAIKMLGGKVRLNAFMKKALESKTEKTYHWTDICKVRFKTFDDRPEQPMRMFMDQVMKSFERFGYISIQKLNDLVISYRILDRNGSGFVMPKHSGEDDYCLAWTNPKDFGIAKEWDKEKRSSYYHIYIRRSPEPLPYPKDWKGEGE